MKFLLRWAIIAASLFVAAWIIPGIQVQGNGWIAFAIMAAVLSLLNATIKPILKMLSCGLIFLTLGLFTLVINAAVFMLASWIAQNWFNVGFYVTDFWAALFGSFIVSIVSVVLSSILTDEKKSSKSRF